MSKRICAGIITYNPDKEVLIMNYEKIYGQVEAVFIIDNDSDNYSEWEPYFKSKVCIVRNDKNIGIASALNQLCEIAESEGYDWCLTLDQDSLCPENLVRDLKKEVGRNTAIVAPNIIYKNNEQYSIEKKGVAKVEWVITSASLTNIKVWKEVKFDDSLFIDGVDRDYCIRARRKGYDILKNYDVQLLHELGNLQCKKIGRKIIYVTNHSNIRKFYMARNAIYLDKKLNENCGKKKICKLILKTLIYEQSMDGIEYIFKGICEGIKMKKIFSN